MCIPTAVLHFNNKGRFLSFNMTLGAEFKRIEATNKIQLLHLVILRELCDKMLI